MCWQESGSSLMPPLSSVRLFYCNILALNKYNKNEQNNSLKFFNLFHVSSHILSHHLSLTCSVSVSSTGQCKYPLYNLKPTCHTKNSTTQRVTGALTAVVSSVVCKGRKKSLISICLEIYQLK